MTAEIMNQANEIITSLSQSYHQFCTKLQRAVIEQPNEPIAQCYNFVGRQVQYLKSDVLPAIQKHTPEAITSLAKNAFWVVPCVAIATGHITDTVAGVGVGVTSYLSGNADSRRLGEHLAIAGFAICALRLTTKALQLIVTKDPSHITSIILNVFYAVKYGMIIDGRNQ